MGMSLTTYLEAAHAEGQAPFSPADLVPVSDIEQHDPNTLLLVSTGSQVCPNSVHHTAWVNFSRLLCVLLPSCLLKPVMLHLSSGPRLRPD